MSDASEPYRFADELPLNPIALGTTVLVAGSALSGAEDVTRALVTEGNSRDEGMLFVSTNETAEKLLAACQRTTSSIDTARLGIIDCSGQAIEPSDTGTRVKYVSTQRDLTGIGMKYSALYQALYADTADGRVRTGLLSLSSLLMYVDLRQLFQFAHTLSGRISSADGIGAFYIDPTAHDTASVNTLTQLADGRIDIRETDDADADGELRVRKLPDQPDGWQPFTLP